MNDVSTAELLDRIRWLERETASLSAQIERMEARGIKPTDPDVGIARREAQEARKAAIRRSRGSETYRQHVRAERDKEIRELKERHADPASWKALEKLVKDIVDVAEKILDHFEQNVDSKGYSIPGDHGGWKVHVDATDEGGVGITFGTEFD